MTDQKQLKRRVRERMEKTGERYTAARAHVVRGAEPAQTVDPDRPSDESIVRATGRGWDAWFADLDAWGAAERTHTETARHLREERQAPGWWAQSITLYYQRSRGLRAPHQQADGFTIGVTRTIAVPVETLYSAVCDPARREAWLPGATLRTRTERPPISARFDWEDGPTRLVASFEDRGDRSRVEIRHERLPDAEAAEARKAFWRERLGVLKRVLEGEG